MRARRILPLWLSLAMVLGLVLPVGVAVAGDHPATNLFAGVWTSTDEVDGSTQTLVISGGPVDARVVYRDDVALVCAGQPTVRFVASGTGALSSVDVLEVSFDDGRCGSHVIPLPDPFTFVHQAATDQLESSMGTWTRAH